VNIELTHGVAKTPPDNVIKIRGFNSKAAPFQFPLPWRGVGVRSLQKLNLMTLPEGAKYGKGFNTMS